MFNVQKIHLNPMSLSGFWSRAPFSDTLINCVHWSDNLLSPTSSISVFRFCSCLGLPITHRWTLYHMQAMRSCTWMWSLQKSHFYAACLMKPPQSCSIPNRSLFEDEVQWKLDSFLSLQLSEVKGNGLKFSCLLYNNPICSLRVTVKTDLCAG